MRGQIIDALQRVAGVEDVHLEVPEVEGHGDYATNIAMAIFSKLQDPNFKLQTKSKLQISSHKSPRELAKAIVKELKEDKKLAKIVDKIEVAGPGFINFWLSGTVLADNITKILKDTDRYGFSENLKGKKIMVEYAHPNTHKELHIGHMRTLILGESLSRILEAVGAEVFRANYQGDIGPHVAKAIWGTKKLLEKRKLTWEEAEKLSLSEKAHLLGEGYVYANREYEENKSDIDNLNTDIYSKAKAALSVYERTRKWSLDYYDSFYTRFDTKFDRLYFETEVAEKGKEIVLKNVGKVFEKSQGAIIFDGEKHGLHKRVFITKDGNPTYEAKDIYLAPLQYSDFPFDMNVHVVANEQKGYFQVMFKALGLIDKKFERKEYHLPMGMVNLVGKKMSSRAGTLITVDQLLEDMRGRLRKLVHNELSSGEKEKIAEITTVGAVKYSMLKVNPRSDVVFDIKKSIDVHGNSGPYLQYTYARIRSVLQKSTGEKKQKPKRARKYGVKQRVVLRSREPVRRFTLPEQTYNKEELALLRVFIHFPEVVRQAAENYAPNLLCNYLFDLAQKFNIFYNQHRILNIEPNKNTPGIERSIMGFRLILAGATGQIIKNGLTLLGIQAPQKM